MIGDLFSLLGKQRRRRGKMLREKILQESLYFGILKSIFASNLLRFQESTANGSYGVWLFKFEPEKMMAESYGSIARQRAIARSHSRLAESYGSVARWYVWQKAELDRKVAESWARSQGGRELSSIARWYGWQRAELDRKMIWVAESWARSQDDMNGRELSSMARW